MKNLKTKIKTRISSKTFIIISLVSLGVILGAVAFNGLVPNVFNSSSVASAVTPTGWTYTYGPDKAGIRNFNNLLKRINDGADVKVKVSNNAYMFTCDVFTIQPNEVDCIKIVDAVGNYTGSIAGYSRWGFHVTATSTGSIAIGREFRYSSNDGGNFTETLMAIDNTNVKWYVRL